MMNEKINTQHLINKKLSINNVEYTIEDTFIEKDYYNISQVYLRLKSSDKKEKWSRCLPVSFFNSENIQIEDSELKDFIAEYNKKYSVEVTKANTQRKVQEEQEKIQRLKAEEDEKREKELQIKNQRLKGSTQAILDARNNMSALYKLFTKHSYLNNLKASKYSEAFRDSYVVSYEEEKRLLKQIKLVQNKIKYSTLDDYPGDIDELISWMKENILKIDVYAPSNKIENEQLAVDVINKRDNTNYKIRNRDGQYISYEAYFKNVETAPKEFLNWKVDKHDYRTSDLSKRVLDYAINIKTGKLTCNSLVKELVYRNEYAFKLGRVKSC